MTIVFAVIAATCGFGWLVSRINFVSMVYYIKLKNLPKPSNEELRQCTHEAVKIVLHLKKRD